jgi:hypothetical protein
MTKNILKKVISRFQIMLAMISFIITPRKKNLHVIGVTEQCSILLNLKSLFNNDSVVVCINKDPFVRYDYDIDISGESFAKKYCLSGFLFGKLAKNARSFIYLWSDGFTLNRESEFKFLYKHKIPIICIFIGSDIRSRKLFLEYCRKIDFNTYVEYDKPEIFLSDKYDAFNQTLAAQADKYASIIFSHPIDQMSYLKSKQWHFPVIIDRNLFSFNEKKFLKMPVKILHAPSSPVLKGTPLVRSVVKMLKSEGYDFLYKELINVPHEDVIMELNKSHIVLNQFYTILPGVFGLESMATGNAVLMSAKVDCYPYKFNNAWYETEDWQLYYNLKFLLDHPEKIIEYARNGYEYMIRYFSTEAIKTYLLGVFSENGLEY